MDLFSAFTAESKPIPNVNANVNANRRPNVEDIDGAPAEKRTREGDDRMNKFLDLKMKELPSITYEHIEVPGNCKAEVCFLEANGIPILKECEGLPAKTFPFTLDHFQKQAILCLENKQSVLVSAHTSAGKTACAEYAISMALRDKQRVIYTSPIKALSNQKYRDLTEEFADVGLMTGDITINPNASCLVMTTEILRSMLYRGSELMREVQFVIFDEIHYMRNAERGVVWEETIILLPDNVRYIFLSATIPNARQFAQWIVYLHKQPCHVVYTDTRPVPLQHYIYPEGGEGIHLIVDVKGEFREDNYQAAMATLRDGGGQQRRRGKNDGKSEDSSIFKLIKMIMENNFQPVISFCFSKRECEENAMQLARLDFNDEQEKKLVEEVFENATDCLSEDDRELPQVKSIVNILKRGIGVHHGGLLPLLKETVEILFSEGLIKCLFATETFAMGVNMPARTVLFTDSQKFDGKEMRVLQSSEYIQMAGRAGRRGLDDKGICILMAGEKMPQNDGTKLMKGDSEPLNSAFHLTYNMVLNLLRVEEINPEYMLEKSFYQFQNRCSIPEFQNQVQNAEEAIDSIKVPEKHMSYFKIRQQLQVLTKKALEIIQKPEYILPYLKPGRLIFIENQEQVFGWGVVISFIKRQDKDGKDYVLVDTLILCDRKSIDNCRGMGVMPKPAKSNNTIDGEMVVVPVTLDCIKKLSSIVLLCPENLKPKEARNKMFDNITETKRRFAGRGPVHDDVLPLIDPVADMGITDKTLVVTLNQIEKFEDRLMDHELHDDANLEGIYKSCEGKAEAEQKLQDAKTKLKNAYQVIKLDELKCRKKILRRMGYATEQDVIELKGRVACEISTADELLLTELMFSNIFDDLDVPQICAFLSCFVCERAPKDDEAPTLQGKLKTLVKQLQDQAKKIARISNECKLDLDEEEYVEKFQIALMDVVHAWAKGCSFSQITEMTSFFEGSIIRVIRRLEELLRDMANAAHTIGNPELEKKFLDGITSIKRDIVFAASLYL